MNQPPVVSAESRVARIVHTRDELRSLVTQARAEGRTVGFVPTMGALHAGHVSLVQAACRECDFIVVSIFVNPTQFGPHEDFNRYPRTLPADVAALAECAVDVVYAPAVEEMYPDGFATSVEVSGVARRWEGERRPGHFAGVATVVLKLFQQVAPHRAYFGRKDYQQSLVVRRMTRDLDLPVEIIVCPTVREADGLALSSRNQYLSAEERRQAVVLSRSLRLAGDLVDQGIRDAAAVAARMRALWAEQPLVVEDYIAIADPDTLEPVERIEHPTVVAIAARLGATRLIDNETIGARLPLK